jgi:GNAT superfamily N-acetyltransferase
MVENVEFCNSRIFQNIKILFFAFIFLCGTDACTTSLKNFFVKKPHNRYLPQRRALLWNEDGTNVIGSLDYGEVLSGGWYLHDFYIDPEHRGKGNAKRLGSYVLETLKKENAHVALMHPGPYEIVRGKVQQDKNAPDYQTKLMELTKSYEKFGFKKLEGGKDNLFHMGLEDFKPKRTRITNRRKFNTALIAQAIYKPIDETNRRKVNTDSMKISLIAQAIYKPIDEIKRCNAITITQV